MARSKKEEKKEFETFNIMASSKNNFEGRVYLEAHSSANGAWFRVSISINDVTIKGVKLWVPVDDNKDCNFLFPSYKDKDGSYQDFIILYNEKIRADAIEVANKLADMIMK